MAPGRVGADEYDQIGFVEVLVAVRHDVGAEGAPVTCDGGRHAEPRIGVDVGRTEEALSELVGDIIIFGQKLAGKIEGDHVRPMLLERPPEAVGHRVESAIPGCALSVDRRIEEPPVGRQSLAERCAFDAEPADVGRMRLVAGDRGAAGAVMRRDHAAADAAIGACRSDARGLRPRSMGMRGHRSMSACMPETKPTR